jgi:hypothetical protein
MPSQRMGLQVWWVVQMDEGIPYLPDEIRRGAGTLWPSVTTAQPRSHDRNS